MRPWSSVSDPSGAVEHELMDLVTATRLIGQEPSLVLHGGGNSSVKVRRTDVTGKPIDVLLMKASGSSMGEATAESFAPLRLDRLRELLPPTVLTDDQFVKEVRGALVDPFAPDPSLETLVHAAIPAAAILHSHADIVLAITNTPDGERRIAEALGGDVIVLDYAMPGFELASVVAAQGAALERAIGAVVPRHGLFTWGATCEEAYEHHRALIGKAQAYVASEAGMDGVAVGVNDTAAGAQVSADGAAGSAESAPRGRADSAALSLLRREISDAAGRNMLVRRIDTPAVREFMESPGNLEAIQRGPLTPDHATRTKAFPMIGTDVAAYIEKYRGYVESNEKRRERASVDVDPAPRVIFDEDLGLLVVGRNAAELAVNADITAHTMATIPLAEKLGGYTPASLDHVFDLEHWDLQALKMQRGKESGALDGQVAIVTGAASGIGRACARSLLDAGCCVVGFDLSPSITDIFDSASWLGIPVDVTDHEAIRQAIGATIEHFGGLDIVVVNAGVFPTSKPLGEMPFEDWRTAMTINVDSVVALYGAISAHLEQSLDGGRVVVVASKNVIAPGTGASAYSSSKAALTQLSRVAALEWAPKGIRVNMLHPDAVFDTGLWTPELLEARAAHYGLSVSDYKRRNLLKTEVTSAAVGELALAMVTSPFRCTTGAQVAIDGGSDRTI